MFAKMRSWKVVLAAGIGLFLGSGQTANAAIVVGDIIAFDVQSGTLGTTVHTFEGIFAPASSTWNTWDANGLAQNVQNTSGVVVTGLTFDAAP